MDTTVLVIEESLDLGKLFEYMLRADGYEVVLVRSWQEAQPIVATRSLDLIIFDWPPEHSDGSSWANSLRTARQTAHIPILFVCGDQPPRVIAEQLGNAGILLIEKPFDIFVFRRRISGLLTPRERAAGAA